MRCPHCEHENPASLKFCGECGARVASVCPACGVSNASTQKFCGECGASLSSSAPAAKFATPGAYTPKHLAEKILTSKAALEGERKQVTVLFADLKGSMELLAERDPEEARKLLDPVLEHMMEAVHRYEGTVNQVMGDGIMALFGAPLAHEDHAVRACYAALRMQESVTQYAEAVFRSHGVPLQIRVGLNSGEVVVRAIGSDLHMDYTAVGQTTHLAARMEQMATPGTILIAPATLQLAEGYVEVTARGPVAVKGLPDSVEIYALTGASASRTRLHAAAARGLTRFVGRDAEIEQIRRALALAHEGRGQLVAIVGEPGVGKSRLVYEFTHSHRTQDWLILESGSVSYGKATSYLPVIDLLKGYFNVHDRETHREIRERVTGKLLTLDRTLELILPALLALLDVPVEDTEWQALDPPQRRRRTLDAVKRLLLRESQLQPLLVIFEDLHWIDSETQALLESLVEGLPTARLLLLVNYRPEYSHGWGSKTYYTQLRLDALGSESAAELLLALLGTDATVEPLKPVLIARTGGNPLFLEESVRTLVETHALTGERGAHRLARPLDTIDVPATVQAILAARIDRLDPPDKQLLQTASVIGKDVPFALLLAIAELGEEDLRRGLARLQAAEFLYQTSLFPDPEYTFKHALTHEVAYGSLLGDRRRASHAQIVEAIEAAHLDRLAEHVERLGHHASRGEVWDKAVAYLRQAGAKALGRPAYREALTFFEQALEALRHLPESRHAREQAIDLRLDMRFALAAFGEFRRTLTLLREADTIATTLDDSHRLGRIAAQMAQSFGYAGDYERAIAAGERAVTLATTSGDVGTRLTVTMYMGANYLSLGDYRRAIDCLRQNMTHLTGDSARERFGQQSLPAALSLGWLAWCLADVGEFVEAIACGEEGVRLAETIDHQWSLVIASAGAGLASLRHGDLSKAIPVLERGLRLCQSAQISLFFPRLASPLGLAYAQAGRLAEGLPLLEQAVEQSATMQLVALHSLWLIHLSEGYRLAGRLDEAAHGAMRALELARAHQERGHQAYALRLLGEVAAHREPSEIAPAETHYRQAMALAEELGMRPLVAHCQLGLGQLSRRTGQREGAREHLTTATTLYREMDMRFWLERAAAAMKELA
ncbi:MAG TPA: adenylate/guanylate cyclase domain-containing protein [Candidatus Bathyarchaeia archaeon]|nr:adenylate/guanylate cyclase domain-containing protein [Candidatus Bathyarchaeia archaeon]